MIAAAMLRRFPNLTNTLVLVSVIGLGIVLLFPRYTARRAAKVETRAEEAGRALLAVATEGEFVESPSLSSAEETLLGVFRAACRELGHPDSYLPTRAPHPESLTGIDCALFESKHYCFMLVRTRSKQVRGTGSTGADQPIAKGPDPEGVSTTPVSPGLAATGSDEAEAGVTDAGVVGPGVAEPGVAEPGVAEPGVAGAGVAGPDRPKPGPLSPLEVYAWPQTLTPPGHTAFFFPQKGESAFTRNLMHQYVGWDESRWRSEMPRPGAGVPKRPRPPQERDYRGLDDERWLIFR